MKQVAGSKEQVGKIRDFTDLVAWQEAHLLTLEIYDHVDAFPQYERFALRDQIRRASISIGSNLAEGFGRRTKQEKIHFYSISLGSITEIQNHLLLARDLGYLASDEVAALRSHSVQVHKLVNGLIKSVRR